MKCVPFRTWKECWNYNCDDVVVQGVACSMSTSWLHIWMLHFPQLPQPSLSFTCWVPLSSSKWCGTLTSWLPCRDRRPSGWSAIATQHSHVFMSSMYACQFLMDQSNTNQLSVSKLLTLSKKPCRVELYKILYIDQNERNVFKALEVSADKDLCGKTRSSNWNTCS